MSTAVSTGFRLGKKRPVVDKRTLRFSKYLTLPTAPQSVTYYEKVNDWPIDTHKVTAFAGPDLKNRSQAQSAIYLLGSIYIGVALPDFAVDPNKDMLTIPWVVPPGGPVGDAAPNPDNGHCIPAVGYDNNQLWIVTWGALKSMSWDFYNAYADESFAVLSQDFVDKSGKSPGGLDLPALKADLAKL